MSGNPAPWLRAPTPGAGLGGTRDGTAAPGQRAGGAGFLDNRPKAQPSSSGPGEGRERRDPRAGTAVARGAPPGLGGRGPHPGARAYRVSALQVTLLVAKGRDVDLHGCARRPADTEQGRLSAHGRRSAPPRPAAPPPSPAPAGPEAARRGPGSAAIPPPARCGPADAAPGAGAGARGCRRGAPGPRSAESGWARRRRGLKPASLQSRVCAPRRGRGVGPRALPAPRRAGAGFALWETSP